GPRPGYWGEWVSLARAVKAPVLLGFNAAEAAASLEGLDDRATIAAALQALRAMFGARFPAPVAAQVTRWGQDPFSLGSYSLMPWARAPRRGRPWPGLIGMAVCGSRARPARLSISAQRMGR
ncbi:MAG TPA: FAD-dependent oxidoreductase, partial [Paracoccaceae bacterium]|nr:FAD-dependent oxidoreductase [Paracoccaceae bacterium]